MIVVDASALVAILMDEPEKSIFIAQLSRYPASMSPVGYWEAAVNMEKYRGDAGVADLDALIALFAITVRPMPAKAAEEAFAAHRMFGRRTPAKLNMGDCFAYALAKELNAPLLFKGGDFSHTDIAAALPA
ncbi:type II toxin-antitoxin system toxin ribonuclease C30 [soil metagenome]